MDDKFINNLYSLFSKYHLNEKVTGHYCSVCLNESINEYFQQTPLREIDTSSLSIYFSSVGIFENECHDFKYFIPRILELISTVIPSADKSWFFDQVWIRIGESKYNEWDVAESSAINDFLEKYYTDIKKTNDMEALDYASWELKRAGYTGDILLF